MLIEQITEFGLRKPGPHGRTCALQLIISMQGLREEGSGGTSYPGLRGPEEFRLPRQVILTWSSPNFGEKMGLNFSEDLFFLVFT